MGTRGYFPQGKAAAARSYHSRSSSTEVKSVWSYISLPQYVFMAWYLR